MTQRSDYWPTAVRFLIAMTVLAAFYLLCRTLPSVMLASALTGLIGWQIRGVLVQGRPTKIPVKLEKGELERLRDLHRRGDG